MVSGADTAVGCGHVYRQNRRSTRRQAIRTAATKEATCEDPCWIWLLILGDTATCSDPTNFRLLRRDRNSRIVGELTKGVFSALSASRWCNAFYSPSQSAYGFIDSTWSNTILIAPVIGMASTSPIAPQTAPQNRSAIVTASGLILRRLPSSFG